MSYLKHLALQTYSNPDFHFKVTPMGAVRMTRADSWKQRPCVIKYRAYKDQLREQAAQFKNKFELKPGMVFLFVFPFFKSYSKKKRSKLSCEFHQQKPDTDNLIKAVFDTFSDKDQFMYGYIPIKIWQYINYPESEYGLYVLEPYNVHRILLKTF